MAWPSLPSVSSQYYIKFFIYQSSARWTIWTCRAACPITGRRHSWMIMSLHDFSATIPHFVRMVFFRFINLLNSYWRKNDIQSNFIKLTELYIVLIWFLYPPYRTSFFSFQIITLRIFHDTERVKSCNPKNFINCLILIFTIRIMLKI